MNIGTKLHSKITHITDYWDDATINQVEDLLKEHEDLFCNLISEMKGIERDLGEMKISLNEDITDEVLDNVGGHEAYYFTDGFSGYH